MPDLLAGTTIKGTDTPPTVSDFQSPSFDATATTYTTASTAGTYADCAVVFTAPTTGRVIIHIASRMTNTQAGNACVISAQIRTGSTVGGGTIFEDADDGRAARQSGTPFNRVGITHLLTGLTPGASYNARLLHKNSASGNTASFAQRELIVAPAT